MKQDKKNSTLHCNLWADMPERLEKYMTEKQGWGVDLMKNKKFRETPEQLAVRKEKERRELARWERERQKLKNKGYIWYTMAILAMIYVVDEITALISTQM